MGGALIAGVLVNVLLHIVERVHSANQQENACHQPTCVLVLESSEPFLTFLFIFKHHLPDQSSQYDENSEHHFVLHKNFSSASFIRSLWLYCKPSDADNADGGQIADNTVNTFVRWASSYT